MELDKLETMTEVEKGKNIDIKKPQKMLLILDSGNI